MSPATGQAEPRTAAPKHIPSPRRITDPVRKTVRPRKTGRRYVDKATVRVKLSLVVSLPSCVYCCRTQRQDAARHVDRHMDGLHIGPAPSVVDGDLDFVDSIGVGITGGFEALTGDECQRTRAGIDREVG